MHESPDYFRLKVSVFNDDKKTDLIGETWVDLNDVIIPGGGQGDHWHPLQFRGRYAGEIRIEMTYYDTRPKEESLMERRKEAIEKTSAAKTTLSSGSTSSSSVVGPRKPKELKRRPLPDTINGSPAGARPSTADKAQRPSSRHGPVPPVMSDHVRHHSKHASKEGLYDKPAPTQVPAPRPARTYETPDDHHQEWESVDAQAHSQSVARHQQDSQHSYPQPTAQADDTHFQQMVLQPECDLQPPLQRRPKKEMLPHRADPLPQAVDRHSGRLYSLPSNTSNHSISKGQIAKYPPQSVKHTYELPSTDRALVYPVSGSPEPDAHYYPHDNSMVNNVRALHNSISREEYHAEYASMQPSVEDGEEDELEEDDEGPPPPPPVHRSGMVSSRVQPTYKAYSADYIPTTPTSAEMKIPIPEAPVSVGQCDDLPPYTEPPAMPPSLIPGYDPSIAEAESDRAMYENQMRHKRSGLIAEQAPASERSVVVQPSRPSSYDSAVYPLRTSARAAERPAVTKGSVNRDFRTVPPRKSISPQPPTARERDMSSIPFSPDSYNVLNPNLSMSATTQDPPQYDAPKTVLDASIPNVSYKEQGPIIGDDGREIDPSDHLPSDTWAPEPERKNRKPEVIVRFKHPPARTSPQPPSPMERTVPRTVIPANNTGRGRARSYVRFSNDPATQSSPRGHDAYISHSPNRGYSAGSAAEVMPRTPHRNSVSPARSPSRSPYTASSFYAPSNPVPAIPSKVPVAAPINHNHPVSSVNRSMDALSRELKSIDIGCSGGRVVRKYAPRTMVTGYAM